MSVFIKSEYDLDYGAFQPFEEAMEPLVTALTTQGWHLLAAVRGITGNVSTVTHLWELPDIDSMMSAPAQAFAADGSLPGQLQKLGAILKSEDVQVMVPLGYHPDR
jgi:hypothetical protein